MFRRYGKEKVFTYLLIMALLNFSYVYILHSNGGQVQTSRSLNTAFAIVYLFGMLYIYYKNRRYVNKPVVIQSMLTQLLLIVLLFAVDYIVSLILDLPLTSLLEFFVSPLTAFIVALIFTAFGLLFANTINYLAKQSRKK